MLLLTLATFASRFLGLLRVSLFTTVLGVNDYTDAFNLATQLPTTIYNIVAGGALLSAFIPIFNLYFLRKKDEKTARHLTSAALNLSTTCMVLLSILGALLAEPLLQWLYASNVPADKLGLVVALTRILFLQTIFLGMGVIVTTPHGYKPGASGMTRLCRPTAFQASSTIFLLPLWSRSITSPQVGHW